MNPEVTALLPTIAIASGVALLVSVIVTPLLRRIAVHFDLVDDPGLRKVHERPVANVGGLALSVSVLSGLAVLLLLDPQIANLFMDRPDQGLSVLLACGAVFLVGLADDIWDLRVSFKALAQVLIATTLYAAGVGFDAILFIGETPYGLGILSFPLTVIWLVGVTNAFNLIDGLDGLAAGIAALACTALAVLGLEQGQYLLAGMSICLIASILGFLPYNLHPARMYLGDSGSLPIGMFIASGSLLALQANASYISIALPLLAASVPILDCLHCMLRRSLDRRSPFSADKGHIHHVLMALGLSHFRAVLILHGISALAMTLGLVALTQSGLGRAAFVAAGLAVVLLFFWAVGYLSFYRILSSLRQLRYLVREEKSAQRSYEQLRLRMREAESFDEWWNTLCHAADVLGFDTVSLDLDRRAHGTCRLEWSKRGSLSIDHPLTFQAPVLHRRRETPLLATVTVDPARSGLEACVARYRLFARLLDEYNLLTLSPSEASRPQPHLADSEDVTPALGADIASTA